MSRRRIAAAMAIAVAVTVLTAPGAGAGHVDPRDPNDTRGLLDVRRVHSGTGWRPYWKINTFGAWKVKEIRDKGFLLVYLDTFGDADFDYYALIRSAGTQLKASLWRDRARKPDRFLRGLTTWRKNRRSVSVRIPLRSVRFPESQPFYFWYVQTLFQNKRNCRNYCFDLVRSDNPVMEPRPGSTS
jgi:hypothetical protein